MTTIVLKESAKRTLSPREKRMMQLLASGMDMHAVADEMSCAYGTLCSYGARIRQKFGVRSLKSAIAMAQEQGAL